MELLTLANIPAIPSGLTVTVYQAGTSTLATLYDRAGAALANPFASDSTGRLEFQAATGKYDVKLGGGAGAPDVSWHGGQAFWVYGVMLVSDEPTYQFPSIQPSLNLDFAKAQTLDPRIDFTRSSEGTYFGADGLIHIAGVDVPRFDFDPVTGECKGLLIEEQRTNLLYDSSVMADSHWGLLIGASVSTDGTLAPDGISLAKKFQEDLSTGVHALRHTGDGVQANTTYTRSVFAKAGDGPHQRIFLETDNYSSWVASGAASFDLVSGDVTTSNPALNPQMASVGGGWYRCSITSTTTATPNNTIVEIQKASPDGASSYTGDGVSFVYIWGAQFEEGSFPTSYIPTTDSPVTRAADIASISGENFKSWYRQDEGSIVMVGDTVSNEYPTFMQLSDGTALKRMRLISWGGSGFRLNIEHPDDYTPIAVADIARDGSPFTAAASWASAGAGDGHVTANGGVPADATSVVFPTSTRMDIGSTRGNTVHDYFANGHIARLAYYPKRLTNAELIGATA